MHAYYILYNISVWINYQVVHQNLNQVTLMPSTPTILCFSCFDVDFYLRVLVLVDIKGDSNWSGDVLLLWNFIKGDRLLTIERNELEEGLMASDFWGLLMLLPLVMALCWRILEQDLSVSIQMTLFTSIITSLKELMVLDWLNSFFLSPTATFVSSCSTWFFSVVLKSWLEQFFGQYQTESQSITTLSIMQIPSRFQAGFGLFFGTNTNSSSQNRVTLCSIGSSLMPGGLLYFLRVNSTMEDEPCSLFILSLVSAAKALKDGQ